MRGSRPPKPALPERSKMTTYSILKNTEEVKLEGVRNALKCFASHLWVSKDSAGHIWPFANCDGCSEAGFCRQIKLTVEKEMN